MAKRTLPQLHIQIVLVLLSLCAFASYARAQNSCAAIWTSSGLISDNVTEAPAPNKGVGFIVPNETQPRRIKAALSNLETGVYLSVGTERGFIGTAFAKGKVKALVLIDRDVNVVTFNQINRALLSVSRNREDYLRLRLGADFSDLRKYTEELLRQDPKALALQDRQTLENPKLWSWWIQNVQNLKAWKSFHQEPSLNAGHEFADSNYLFDDKMFAVVSRLAKDNRVFVYHENLGTRDLASRIQELTSGLKTKISVVDLSNSWQEGYLGHEGSLNFMASINGMTIGKTLLILSYLKSGQARAVESVFDYSVLNLADIPNSQYLYQHLGQLARQEPSQQPQYRGRYSRFDLD